MKQGLKIFYRDYRWTLTAVLLWPLLLVLSFFYGACVVMRRFFYNRGIWRSYRASVPVISVGNITLGGTGKTPLVEYIASYLSHAGLRTAVVLRSYKKPREEKIIGHQDYYRHGDEGGMLQQNLSSAGVIISTGVDRCRCVRELEEKKCCDVVVLDDGFQHLRLARDLDIVAMDAVNPFGNGWMLPAGPLREPRSSLRCAHVFCLTRCDEATPEAVEWLADWLGRVHPNALVVKSVHAPVALVNLKTNKERSCEEIRGRQVGLLCGVARPESVARLVQQLGGVVAYRQVYDDHHEYTRQEIIDFFRQCGKRNINYLVTTQKDAVRIARLVHHEDDAGQIFALRVAIKVLEGQESFHDRLRSLCHF